MANIARHDIDALNISIELTIPKEETGSKFKSSLNRLAQTTTIKGFRKGKTPVSYIKKMYGGEVMSDVVNKIVSDSVAGFLEENKLNILGQPIPSKEHIQNNFSIDVINDLTFKFDIGLVPTFDVKGLDKSFKFTKMIPQVPTAWVDEALETDRNRSGEPQSIEGGDLQAKDIIKVDAKEVGGTIEASFSVLFDDLSEDAVAKFSTMKKGDKGVFDIMNLEKNASEERVRKYILDIDNSVAFGKDFEFTINDITRVSPAELNEAFFQKAYGEEITTETAARERLEVMFGEYFVSDSWGLLVRELQQHIIDQNPLDLPDEFLQRWLTFSDERNTAELVEKDYPRFAQNMRWTLLRDRIINDLNVHVHEADIIDAYRDRLRGTYGTQMGEEFLTYFAERMMQDARKKKSKEHEEVVENALFNCLFKVVANQVDITDINVTWEEFDAKRNQALAAARSGNDENVAEEAEIMDAEI